MQDVLFEFGVVPGATLRGDLGRWVKFDMEARLAVAASVAELTHRMHRAIEQEFIRGTDSQGESHNKTGFTLSTLTVTAGADWAAIRMGGGAPYIETGTRPHIIQAVNAPFLHFQTYAGNWIMTDTIYHPGTPRDPFIERAMGLVDLGFELRRLASRIFADLGFDARHSGAAGIARETFAAYTPILGSADALSMADDAYNAAL